jgi:K+-sensing histidine kinase KdpD
MGFRQEARCVSDTRPAGDIGEKLPRNDSNPYLGAQWRIPFKQKHESGSASTSHDTSFETSSPSTLGLSVVLLGARSPEEAVEMSVGVLAGLYRVPTMGWLAPVGGGPLKLRGMSGFTRERTETITQHLSELPARLRNSATEQDTRAHIARTVAVESDIAIFDQQRITLAAATSSRSISMILARTAPVIELAVERLTEVQKAKQRNENLDLALAWVSHELNRPLVGVSVALEQILHSSGLGERARILVERCWEEVADLSELLDRMLEVTIGEDDDEGHPVADLASIARAVVESRMPSTVDIAVSAPASVSVQAPEHALVRTVQTLIDHAVQEAPDSTIVDVAVTTQNGQATLSISDRGRLVPFDRENSMFDPLARNDLAVSSRERNALDLLVARRAVENYGGSLWLESGSNSTTFRVQLPRVESQSHARTNR